MPFLCYVIPNPEIMFMWEIKINPQRAKFGIIKFPYGLSSYLYWFRLTQHSHCNCNKCYMFSIYVQIVVTNFGRELVGPMFLIFTISNSHMRRCLAAVFVFLLYILCSNAVHNQLSIVLYQFVCVCMWLICTTFAIYAKCNIWVAVQQPIFYPFNSDVKHHLFR